MCAHMWEGRLQVCDYAPLCICLYKAGVGLRDLACAPLSGLNVV